MCKHSADAELLQDWGVRENQVVPDRRSDMYQVSQAYPFCLDMLHVLAVSSLSPATHLPTTCPAGARRCECLTLSQPV